MLTEIDLMQWIEHFGRWNVQELVAQRQDMWDVITYLRAERSLELAKRHGICDLRLGSFRKGRTFKLCRQEV